MRTFANVLKAAVLNRLGVVQRPSFVTFFVTWACNHRCVFCDVWKKTPADEMTTDEIVAAFRPLGRLDVLRLSGGEPFIRKDLAEIINILDEINRPGLIHLTTNGILTNRIAEIVEKVRNPGKLHIKVSIDAVDERHDQGRGVPGAFSKAMETVRMLAGLRDRGIHVGVNQSLMNAGSMDDYRELKTRLEPLGVPIYAAIAYDSSHTLYAEGPQRDVIDVQSTIRPFGDWTPAQLTDALKLLAGDNKKVSDFKERLVDTYFVNGLYTRMVEGTSELGPRCVALNNHLRVLPNGDVPICLHNAKVIGNLRRTPFDQWWFGAEMEPHRRWVAECPGCWVSCETAVSAIYTGDIWKGLRQTEVTR